jgi:hypothetical protein
MIERGDDLAFAGESLDESLCRYLDGDLTRQAGILRRYTSPMPPTPIWAIVS